MTRIKTSLDNLIVVVMGAESRADSLKETTDLIRYGLKNY